MEKYKIVSILWLDHARFTDSKMIPDPDEAITPTLSVGVLYKQTENTYVVVSDIERYEDRDDTTYMVIQRATIVGEKEYGEIELEKLRE